MRWNEVTKKLKRIGYKEGLKSKHRTIWNCPCLIGKGAHPVGVENHLTKEAYPYDYKRKLGPHLKDFGKI